MIIMTLHQGFPTFYTPEPLKKLFWPRTHYNLYIVYNQELASKLTLFAPSATIESNRYMSFTIQNLGNCCDCSQFDR